jgi:NAD-dependent dihydropyrimidine dehydrogenase PreA subunit
MIKQKEEVIRMIKELQVDTEKCTKCKLCVDVCFENVIEWEENESKPYAKYPMDCQACCICETACPVKAITVIPDWSKKYYPKYVSTLEG